MSQRLFAILGLAAITAAGAAGASQDPPLRVATVNLKACFDKDKVAYVKDLLADFEKTRNEVHATIEALEKRLTDLAEQLKGLDKKTGLYQEKLRAYKLTEAEYEATGKISKAQLRSRYIAIMTDAYGEIQRVVDLVTAEDKLDLVLRTEEPDLDEESPELALQRISSRVILQASDRNDLTKKVIDRLNAEHAKRKK